MSAADRITPWELVFSEERFSGDLFPALEEEARGRGAGTSFDAFLMLRTSARILHALESDGADEGEPDGRLPAATTVRSYGRLVWQAWHFWRAGCRVFSFDGPATRALLDDAPVIGHWTLQPPAIAGYAQVARNLIWARVDPSAHAEPLDGFFWLFEPAAGKTVAPLLHLLLVLGLRDDRPGVSVIEITASLEEPAGHWADTRARADGPDFGNILPGGEVDRLHGMVSTVEALKLASRAFRALAAGNDGEGD